MRVLGHLLDVVKIGAEITDFLCEHQAYHVIIFISISTVLLLWIRRYSQEHRCKPDPWMLEGIAILLVVVVVCTAFNVL